LGAEEWGPQTSAERSQALQAHLCARADSLGLPETAEKLKRELQSRLLKACDEGLLAMKPHDVHACLWLSGPPRDATPESKGIYGGDKDFKRTGDKRGFRRGDGAWFTFSITVRARRGRPLEIVAYDFELCFPVGSQEETGLPRFVRFDLNEPGHANDAKGLRCHAHPGHDDLSVPAPLMSPVELLDLFLAGELAVPARPRKA
jgi:hypothetical protein